MPKDTPEPVKRMVNDKHHVALLCQVPEEVYEYYTNWLTTAATTLYNDAVREEKERCKNAIRCREDIDGDVCDCCRANYDRIDDPNLTPPTDNPKSV